MGVKAFLSLTREQAEGAPLDGPSRDVLRLAAATGAEVRFASAGAPPRGIRGRLTGPHMRQAWTAAKAVDPGDAVFFDGEHTGLPAALFMSLRRTRPAHITILAHYPAKRWKLPLIWLGSRLGTRATIAVHSEVQRVAVQRVAGSRWGVALVPYQVDTAFWTPGSAGASEAPFVLAVGSEHRDYTTLVAAARGLETRLVIAAGSHWARKSAAVDELPPNVELITTVLSFADLRDLYRRAALVVVPLDDVANQSGVTTLLEAMACARAVVVTATRGQREVVNGPLARAGWELDESATADRGPQIFGGRVPGGPSGIYVAPGDVAALRAVIMRLVDDAALAATMGEAGRTSVTTNFDTRHYVAALAELITQIPATKAPAANAGVA